MNFTPKDVAILVLAIILIIGLFAAYRFGMGKILPDVWTKLQSMFDGAANNTGVSPNSASNP